MINLSTILCHFSVLHFTIVQIFKNITDINDIDFTYSGTSNTVEN